MRPTINPLVKAAMKLFEKHVGGDDSLWYIHGDHFFDHADHVLKRRFEYFVRGYSDRRHRGY